MPTQGPVLFLFALVSMGAACNLTTFGTCYVQEPTTVTGSGSVNFAHPGGSATRQIIFRSLFDATDGVYVPSVGYFELVVTQSLSATGNILLSLVSTDGPSLAAIEITQLPTPGTYSLGDVAVVTACPSAAALADGGSSGSATGSGAGCGLPTGTLVVTTNSAGPCHPSAGSSQPPTQACPTEFAAQLTFSVSDSLGTTTFSGMLSFDYQQPVMTYSCNGSD
jgi:hypothetical protein